MLNSLIAGGYLCQLPTFIGYMLWARHCFKHFLYLNPFNPNNLWGRNYSYPYFTEKAKARNVRNLPEDRQLVGGRAEIRTWNLHDPHSYLELSQTSAVALASILSRLCPRLGPWAWSSHFHLSPLFCPPSSARSTGVRGPQLMPFPHPLDPALPASWPLEGARSRNSRVTGVWQRPGRGLVPEQRLRGEGQKEGRWGSGDTGKGRRAAAGEMYCLPLRHPTTRLAPDLTYSFHSPKTATPRHLGVLLKLEIWALYRFPWRHSQSFRFGSAVRFRGRGTSVGNFNRSSHWRDLMLMTHFLFLRVEY